MLMTTYDYPYTNKGGYMFRCQYWLRGRPQYVSFAHREIYSQHHNISIPKGYVIHHRDGNKKNNEIDNLEMMNNVEHLRLHNIGRKKTEEQKQKNTGMKHYRAALISIKHEDGRTDTGCCRELARKHNFDAGYLAKHRKAKGWFIIE